MVIEADDAGLIDRCFDWLPSMLALRGLALEQRHGYKAGKISKKRNWCQIVDGDVLLPVRFPDAHGVSMTWKLFARFSAPPSKHWERPEPYERKKAQWMPAGDDVWGISYEHVKSVAATVTCAQLLEQIATDLAQAFSYARRHYRRI